MPYLIRKNLDGTIADRRELTEKEVIAGRGDTADMKTNDAEMSRAHFKITGQGGAFTLEDLGSQNGTYINGQRLATAQLKANDQIRAGETHFVFTTDNQPEAMPTIRDMHEPKVLK